MTHRKEEVCPICGDEELLLYSPEMQIDLCYDCRRRVEEIREERAVERMEKLK